MNLENINTENDAIQALVEKIVKINNLLNKTSKISEVEEEMISYNNFRGYCINRFFLDTTPYDEVIKQMVPLQY